MSHIAGSYIRKSYINTVNLAVATVVASLLAEAAFAQAVHWTGVSGSNWNNPGNWSAGTPSGSSSAVIATNSGDNVPVLDGDSSTISGLLVGSLDGSDLEVRNGGVLTVGSATIGNNSINNAPANRLSEQSGTLRLTGTGSQFSTNFLNLGLYGEGLLEVEDGATLTVNSSVSLSTFKDSVSQLTIHGEETSAQLSGVTIGGNGEAAATVSNGASVTSGAVTLGRYSGATGALEITGNGSDWTLSSGTLNVGGAGDGSVSVSNGGSLSSTGRLILASDVGATGELTIEGADSSVATTNYVSIGGSGSGSATISDGGRLQGAQILVAWDDGVTATLDARGSESRIGVRDYLMVGYNGNGIATFSDGATLEATSAATANLVIANAVTSTGIVNIGAARGSEAAAAGHVALDKVLFGAGTGELVFNHNTADYQFDAAIVNNGTLSHLAGDTTLTGDNSNFSGTTNVNGGHLRITNALGGDVNVFANSRFGGAGTVGRLNVTSGGEVALSGTIAVEGDADFAVGSYFLVNADPTGNDLLSVDGFLLLNGGTVVHQESAAEFDPTARYKIAESTSGVFGEFDDVQTELAFLDASLSYENDEVWLGLDRNDINFSDIALSQNQKNLGQALAGLELSDPLVQQILGMSEETARQAYNQLAGEIHGSNASAIVRDSAVLRSLLLSRLRQQQETLRSESVSRNAMSFMQNSAYPAGNFWMQGVGSWSDFDGNGNAVGTRRDFGGLALGYDREMANGVQVGLMAGYSNTSTRNDVEARSDADSATLGLYFGTTGADLRLSGGMLASWHNVDTSRSLESVGMGTALGRYEAHSYSIFAEASYEYQLERGQLQPFFGLAHVSYDSDGFSETGGSGALTVAAISTETSYATLGLRGQTKVAFGSESLLATGMLGWRHAFGDINPSQTAWLQGNAMNIEGMPVAENELLIEAGLGMEVSPKATFNFSYSGRLSDDYADHGVRAHLKVAF